MHMIDQEIGRNLKNDCSTELQSYIGGARYRWQCHSATHVESVVVVWDAMITYRLRHKDIITLATNAVFVEIEIFLYHHWQHMDRLEHGAKYCGKVQPWVRCTNVIPTTDGIAMPTAERAKNLCKRTVLVQLIIKNVVTYIHTYVLYYNDDRPHQNTRVNMFFFGTQCSSCSCVTMTKLYKIWWDFSDD